MKANSNKQRGFLSIDGVMWLMLVAVALGFILWFGWRMVGGSDVAIEQSNVSSLIASAKKLRGTSGYGASGTNLVPALINVEGTGTMGVSGTSIFNQWGGTVSVVSNGMTFTITSAQLPKSACITLASKLANDRRTTTSINGGSAVAGEVMAATASTSCSSDSNTIAWTIY